MLVTVLVIMDMEGKVMEAIEVITTLVEEEESQITINLNAKYVENLDTWLGIVAISLIIIFNVPPR